MNKIKNALIRFSYGRYLGYGVDALHKFLQWSIIILILIEILFVNSYILTGIIWAMLVYQIFRMFSKNIYKRRAENTKFLTLVKPITKRIGLVKKAKQDKTHKYFVCPTCKQSVRVPKGKGKITITCPKCGCKFSKKS